MKTEIKQPIPAAQIASLRIILASKIEAVENFQRIRFIRHLSHSNEPKAATRKNQVIISREPVADVTANQLVYDDGNFKVHMDETRVLDQIELLIREGYDEIICESFTDVVNAQIKSGRIEINLGRVVSLPHNDTGHPIKIGEADRLLEVLDILTPEGKIKNDKSRRKYEQINHFIKRISDQLEKVSQRERLTIVDCGCGKSYLSFVLNYFLREKLKRQCKFFCIDTSDSLIQKCQQMQGDLDYTNMVFQQRRVVDFEPPTNIDILCSLHACDTATDETIALGVQAKASLIMVVPCCQSEILNQLETHALSAVTRYGPFAVKFADLLTDALRVLLLEANGYKITVTEFISPIYTPKNLLIIAEKIQSRNSMALAQYRELVEMFQVSPALERYLNVQENG